MVFSFVGWVLMMRCLIILCSICCVMGIIGDGRMGVIFFLSCMIDCRY